MVMRRGWVGTERLGVVCWWQWTLVFCVPVWPLVKQGTLAGGMWVRTG